MAREHPPVEAPANSIDEVVAALDDVIGWARDNDARLGYFAALYQKVTLQVREGIARGDFDDGERMERFDVIFANRYLQALIDVRDSVAPSHVWRFAFDAADAYWPIVLQHLLLGMNAHINLDLGIAAAQTMRGEHLDDLRGDFNRINAVLAALVDSVQEELAEVWMTLRLFNRFLGDINDELINFKMERARDEAWGAATRLAATPEAGWPAAIAAQDDKVLAVARMVRNPGLLLGTATHIVRLGEVQDVGRVIDILNRAWNEPARSDRMPVR